MKRLCSVLILILLMNIFTGVFAADISYNDAARSVVLSGTVTDYSDGDNVTAMLIKRGAQRENLKPSDLLYIGQQALTSGGEYNFEFKIGKNFDFDNAEVFVSCRGNDVTGLLKTSYVTEKYGNVSAYSDGKNIVYKSDEKGKTAYAAFFSDSGSLISAQVIGENDGGKAAFPKDTQTAKLFVWQNGTLAPCMKVHLINKGIVRNVKLLFPGFTNKALTFSYDDGPSSDAKLIALFDKYGIKSTFNFIGNQLEEKGSDYKAIYENHEAASHSYGHFDMRASAEEFKTTEECISTIVDGKTSVAKMFGSCTGFAWPITAPVDRSDYAALMDTVKQNYDWARTVKSTGSFDLPSDWYEWNPTCKHDDMFKYANDFVNGGGDDLKLFYIWGHSFEFAENYNNNFYLIEDFAEFISKYNVWKATNSEIYSYVKAGEKLVVSGGAVYNPSDVDLYIEADGAQTVVAAGKTYYGYNGETEYTAVFPNFANKAFVLSVDDGKAKDQNLVEILNPNGIKATFNVHYKNSNFAARYQGHEVASHSDGHINMSASASEFKTTEECIAAIKNGKTLVEDMFGEGSCTGFAWPYGVPVTRSDYAEISAAVKETYSYARAVLTSKNFDLPSDWYDFHTTCRITELNDYVDAFLSDNGNLRLLSAWGHSSDLDESTTFGWTEMENFCKKIGAETGIWKATTAEVCEYSKAIDALKMQNNILYNPSDVDVYVIANGENTVVPANGFVDFNG